MFGSSSGSMVSDSSVHGTGETVLSVYLSPGSVAFTLRGAAEWLRCGWSPDDCPQLTGSRLASCCRAATGSVTPAGALWPTRRVRPAWRRPLSARGMRSEPVAHRPLGGKS